MKHKQLGRSSLHVPVVSFGAFAIGGWYWGGTDDKRAIAALHAALDAGMNAIDTAPIYGFGHSERVVGKALADRRADALIMTKVGLRWDTDEGVEFFPTAGPDGKKTMVRRNAKPESIRTEVDQSLERLGVETLDLVQVHWPDPSTPIAETMGALAELRSAGKLREIGVSNYTPEMMQEAQDALGDVPLASNQPKYSLVAREIEADVLPWAREHQVGLVVYSPLDQGLLTGKVRADRTFPPGDGRGKRPSFRAENRARVNAVLDDVVLPIAESKQASIAQTVLAWTAAQEGISSLLVGARDENQALENARAGEIELAAEELSAIADAFSQLELV
ncbi:MAG: methylglyoxal reductase [Planctomycetota bacterium]|jgi:methylglyoxal reductase